MPEIRTDLYTAKPSDARNWVFVESPNGTVVDVEVAILDFRYDCVPQRVEVDINGTIEKIWCSRFCCYAGSYTSPDEILRTRRILPAIKKDLQPDSLHLLEEQKGIFHLPDDHDEVENLYKTCCAPAEWKFTEEGEDESEEEGGDVGEDEGDDVGEDEGGEEDDIDLEEVEYDDSELEFALPPKNHCIFLMENGLCATHKYYLENNRNWVKEKFNICVTFPLDLRPDDKTIAFMGHFDEFAFTEVHCLTSDEAEKEKRGYPQIIESMKNVIVDRYNEDFWNALNAFARDYRDGKITVNDIYSEYVTKPGE